MPKIKVLQVDQWTSTGNITDFTMKDFGLGKVQGGDSAAVKVIFGGSAMIRWVDKDDRPPIAHVWFRTDRKTRKLKLFKANYDSSD